MSLRPSPWNSRPLSKWFSGRWRAVTTAVRKSPGKILGAALGVVIVAAVTVGGLGFVQGQRQIDTITQFCTDLKAQNYDAAYGLLSASVRGQFSDSTHFQQVMGILDTMTVSGKVTDCHLNEPGRIPWIGPSSSTGSRLLLIHRQVSGDAQGSMQVKQEGGEWKVDSLTESLLTVSLSAVATAIEYCSALENLDFGTAYRLLSSKLHATLPGATTQFDFNRSQILHYVVDGQITDCSVKDLHPTTSDFTGNSDTQTGLDMTITYANAGTSQPVTVVLMNQHHRWLIDSMDPVLQGTDIGPLQVGYQLCKHLAEGTSGLPAAYMLLSTAYSPPLSSTDFAKLFPAAASGGSYRGCLPDFSTYKVSQSTASFSVGVNVLGNPSATPAVPPSILHIALSFTKQSTGQSTGWFVTNISTTM